LIVSIVSEWSASEPREPELRGGSEEAGDAQLVHPPRNWRWVLSCASGSFGALSVQPTVPS